MTWAELFERAAAYGVDEAAVREALAERRGDGPDAGGSGEGARAGGSGEVSDDAEADDAGGADAPEADRDDGGDAPDPGGGPAATEPMARVVADADVLAADLLCGGPAREALDIVRAHGWVSLVASEPLLDDAAAVVGSLADDALAADWRTAIEPVVERVEHPAGDHPALASALRGDARHVLSFDESLRSAAAGAAIRERVETSVKHPDAFVGLFDPASMYPVVVGGEYPGPDRDPRA